MAVFEERGDNDWNLILTWVICAMGVKVGSSHFDKIYHEDSMCPIWNTQFQCWRQELAWNFSTEKAEVNKIQIRNYQTCVWYWYLPSCTAL